MGIIKISSMPKQVAKGSKAKKPTHKFSINCSDPVEDNVMLMPDFEQYLQQHIKVEGKKNNLGQNVVVARDKNTISKRYLKYLTKKYLAKQELRQYLRVIATNK